MVLESCVENIEQARLAERKGAHRLELCSNLELDGLSPSIELIKHVLNSASIPVHIMVRMKPGAFCYSSEDIAEMIAYCESCINLPISGFVIGMLTDDNQIDIQGMQRLLSRFPSLPFTFHKAIDEVKNPVLQLRRCDHLENLKYVLTSGGEDTALNGKNVIREMVQELEPRFRIIAAGKVNIDHIDALYSETGATQYHGRNLFK